MSKQEFISKMVAVGWPRGPGGILCYSRIQWISFSTPSLGKAVLFLCSCVTIPGPSVSFVDVHWRVRSVSLDLTSPKVVCLSQESRPLGSRGDKKESSLSRFSLFIHIHQHSKHTTLGKSLQILTEMNKLVRILIRKGFKKKCEKVWSFAKPGGGRGQRGW